MSSSEYILTSPVQYVTNCTYDYMTDMVIKLKMINNRKHYLNSRNMSWYQPDGNLAAVKSPQTVTHYSPGGGAGTQNSGDSHFFTTGSTGLFYYSCPGVLPGGW